MAVSTKNSRKKLWESMTRQGIVEAVVRVLGAQGMQGLTMDLVAEQAGVAKGTLYVYFKNKQELLKATIEVSLAPLIKNLNELLDSRLPPDEKVRALVSRHLGFFDENRPLFRVLMYELTQARWKRFGTSRYESFISRLAAALEEGCRDGSFRPVNCVHLAAMLMESDIAIIHQRLHCDNPGPVEEDARLVAETFLLGISQDPLRKKMMS